MNRSTARKIAEVITNEQIMTTLNTARHHITDWLAQSKVNKGMSKGLAWNILASEFDPNKSLHILAKINIVREFSEYVPTELLINQPKPQRQTKVTHQVPNFEKFDKMINEQNIKENGS